MAIESETKGIRIAIDRGGTFCDLYVVHVSLTQALYSKLLMYIGE